ncbi:MAG TPA: alpha/beta hydrolase [Candidatus Eisenbacteria bacterium]|nr:alpha/beta hydrolase [Candidatus Eisenbacteria bacterium]
MILVQLALLLLAAVPLCGIGLAIFSGWTARRVEKALPPSGKFVQVEGARIHYWEKGSGPAIVLVHGLGGQSLNFSFGVADQLSRDFRVLAIDRPGSGYSTREADELGRLSAQSALVAKFIAAMGLERPLLVGHSLGGAISLGVALNFPEAVSGLALVAPLTHVLRHPPGVFRPLEIESPFVRRLVAWTLATPMGIRRGPDTLRRIFAPERVPQDFPVRGGGLLGLRPRAFYNVSTDLMGVTADLFAMVQRYGELRLPVGILYGTNDQVLNHGDHGEAMRGKAADLRLKLVEGGHMLPVTQPELTAEFICEEARRAGLTTERKMEA